MITLSNIEHVSDFIKTRASSMWVTRLKSADPLIIIYRVRPHSIKENKGKHPRIVTVNLAEDTAECCSRWDGTICEANSFANLCCHIYRALQAIAAASDK